MFILFLATQQMQLFAECAALPTTKAKQDGAAQVSCFVDQLWSGLRTCTRRLGPLLGPKSLAGLTCNFVGPGCGKSGESVHLIFDKLTRTPCQEDCNPHKSLHNITNKLPFEAVRRLRICWYLWGPGVHESVRICQAHISKRTFHL